MDSELANLRKRLQQEEEHLAWFLSSGQTMTSNGADTTDAYLTGVRDRIAMLKKQIQASSQDRG